jgi:energy-coupling factor transporter ATP-binding protein EcfA2
MQQPTKTIQSRYNYNDVWEWLQQRGKALYGKKFQLHEEDKQTIYLLLCWFLQDDIAAPQLELDLEKGILLSGPVGCGKTTLMSLMRFVTADKNKFIMKSCRDISFEFIEDGFSVIHKYSKGTLYQYLPKNYCFDDLGVESSLKYYGNECNVMAEILLTRYDLFVSQKLITHLTTNLSASEIEDTYGNRVRSRLREMFNLIAFDNNSFDKRQ